MSREVLYVAMTRGRHANTAYVCTDTDVDDDEYGTGDQQTPRDVLETVLARTCAQLSAHETMRAEHERAESIARLAAEYDTIARQAHRQRWAALTGPGSGDHAHWPAPALASAVGGQTLIAGLIPAAARVSDPELRQALAERAALIEQRADALVTRAVTDREPWITRLGTPPHHPAARLSWERAAATVAAYRDRHGITDPYNPIGQPHGGGQWTRRADRRRATAAIAAARRASQTTIGNSPRQSGPQRPTDQPLGRRL
jgi:hypothetical protein